MLAAMMDASALSRIATAPLGPYGEQYTLIAIGAIEVGQHLALWDGMAIGREDRTKHDRAATTATCRSGSHDVLALVDNRNGLPVVMVRRPDAHVASWRELTIGFDFDGFALIGPDPLPPIQPPKPASDALKWVVVGRLPDGLGFVWIDDPSGGGEITAHVGLDAAGVIAAFVVELYWS